MVIVPPKISRRKGRKARERDRELLRQRQRKILLRIQNQPAPERDVPMIAASNIHYELGQRVHGLSAGGIGAMVLLARNSGLISAIDTDLHLLKRHLPYHESDHVLNIALNILAGGRRLEHIELLRNDAVFLDALDAAPIIVAIAIALRFIVDPPNGELQIGLKLATKPRRPEGNRR